MQKPVKKEQPVKPMHRIYNGIDSHKWATKMEIQRLISSKSDIKAIPRVVN